MMYRILILSVVSVLLAGCASVPQRLEPAPGVEVPEVWTTADAPAGPVVEDWWTSFGDPVLPGLIEEALEHNRDLRAAATRIDQAAAQARISGADLRPSLQAGFTASRQKQNFIGFPDFGEMLGSPGGAGGSGSSGNGDSGGVTSVESTSLGVSLDTSWEADLWGRLRAGHAASLADLEAARAEYAGARLSLAGQTAKAWFALTEARQQHALARSTVGTFRTSAETVRDRYERGLRPSLDLRLAEANLSAAEALVEQRREQVARLERQLEVLLGRYPRGGPPEGGSLLPVPPPVPVGLPAEILARRPDLAAAERRLAAADARLKQARRALYPRLTLTGSLGRRSEELEDLLDGDFSVWSLAAGLMQPLFQGGRLRAGVDLADARTREALEAFAGAALRAFSEVESALTAESFLMRREESLAAAAEHSVAARRLTEDRYAAGLAGVFDVLEAQRRALEAESQLLAVRRQLLDNRIDLHLSLGGSFKDDQPPSSSARESEETSS